jgi:hypothetical protein
LRGKKRFYLVEADGKKRVYLVEADGKKRVYLVEADSEPKLPTETINIMKILRG